MLNSSEAEEKQASFNLLLCPCRRQRLLQYTDVEMVRWLGKLCYILSKMKRTLLFSNITTLLHNSFQLSLNMYSRSWHYLLVRSAQLKTIYLYTQSCIIVSSHCTIYYIIFQYPLMSRINLHTKYLSVSVDCPILMYKLLFIGSLL